MGEAAAEFAILFDREQSTQLTEKRFASRHLPHTGTIDTRGELADCGGGWGEHGCDEPMLGRRS